MSNTILWMHDLSDRADLCEAPVRFLAGKLDSDVILTHALGEPVASRRAEGDPGLAARRAAAEHRLNPIRDRLSLEGFAATVELHEGQPLELAERLVAERQVSLVVAGANGLSGLDRALLGSTASKLLRHLSCSVLVVRSSFSHLGQILCAVDLARPPEAAILQAAALARRTGAALTWITVVEPAFGGGEVEQAEAELGEAVARVLGPELNRGWPSQVITAEGPVHGILHRAAVADLVIMGTRGHTGIKRLLLGSVAASVVEQCPSSVLVAR